MAWFVLAVTLRHERKQNLAAQAESQRQFAGQQGLAREQFTQQQELARKQFQDQQDVAREQFASQQKLAQQQLQVQLDEGRELARWQLQLAAFADVASTAGELLNASDEKGAHAASARLTLETNRWSMYAASEIDELDFLVVVAQAAQVATQEAMEAGKAARKDPSPAAYRAAFAAGRGPRVLMALVSQGTAWHRSPLRRQANLENIKAAME
ncbi:hypothetical protein ACFVQ3_16685 [Oerskovia sp. NPDC057915]|uniref:hypothetical protein n=1 Tax=Oerskovia sp. NPDC057915 TaxID=3346280 RepID=UPI0036D9C617